jgi:hypothetical protein
MFDAVMKLGSHLSAWQSTEQPMLHATALWLKIPHQNLNDTENKSGHCQPQVCCTALNGPEQMPPPLVAWKKVHHKTRAFIQTTRTLNPKLTAGKPTAP